MIKLCCVPIKYSLLYKFICFVLQCSTFNKPHYKFELSRMEVILNGKTKLQVKDLFKKQNRTTMNSFDDFNDDEERR